MCRFVPHDMKLFLVPVEQMPGFMQEAGTSQWQGLETTRAVLVVVGGCCLLVQCPNARTHHGAHPRALGRLRGAVGLFWSGAGGRDGPNEPKRRVVLGCGLLIRLLGKVDVNVSRSRYRSTRLPWCFRTSSKSRTARTRACCAVSWQRVRGDGLCISAN